MAAFSLARMQFWGSATLATGVFLTYLIPDTLLFIPLFKMMSYVRDAFDIEPHGASTSGCARRSGRRGCSSPTVPATSGKTTAEDQAERDGFRVARTAKRF